MNGQDDEIGTASHNGHGEPIEEGDRKAALATTRNGHGEGSDDEPEAGPTDGNGHGEGDNPAPAEAD